MPQTDNRATGTHIHMFKIRKMCSDFRAAPTRRIARVVGCRGGRHGHQAHFSSSAVLNYRLIVPGALCILLLQNAIVNKTPPAASISSAASEQVKLLEN